jgi:hypothetical protein
MFLFSQTLSVVKRKALGKSIASLLVLPASREISAQFDRTIRWQQRTEIARDALNECKNNQQKSINLAKAL